MYQEIDYDPYQQLTFETKNASMTFEIDGYEYIILKY